jgi:hypothetical protein
MIGSPRTRAKYDSQRRQVHSPGWFVSESKNIATLGRFVEEVINQGRLDAADELVEADFIELDPLRGQRQVEKV